MKALIALESGFRPGVVSSSGATGLGQFTRGTWLDRIKTAQHPELKALQKLSDDQKLLKRSDPRLNAIATVENLRVAERRIQNAFRANGIVSKVTVADLYAYHNIGNPSMSVAARQNKLAKTAVSSSAMALNSGLYINGDRTTARQYLDRVNKLLEQKLYDINRK
ncbi:lytic transglycosylase domain-containing protein (plasmid) [Acinetobacter indicus]|uniref:lytic transglycosylase domain-containing protein n=1 Tax=Acinetobacter indicus TaxID=756892 RepID=UPI001FA7B2B0|nr:lytic transglycosylase domain-containing protein [Acinetobacter indicus]UNW11114.1 lytic transglycosylase domain-containing protein [Acinetobacter indicus]